MTVAVAAALPVYDWQEPAPIQNHDWDCSEEAIRWCLLAWGRTPDDSWMEASLIQAGVVTPASGCTDASGAGLASWVNREYAEFGYRAENEPYTDFDAVATEARTHKHPLAIGGRGWYHWSGVRGYDELLDCLQLANPANGYRGVYQTLSRAQWDQLGPFSLVRVTHPAAEGQQPTTLQPPGIDVASHQGWVDWTAFRGAGGQFAFTKATGGVTYRNPTLEQNWSGIHAAAVKRGAYHFAFEPSMAPLPGPGPTAEADYFLDAVIPLGLGSGDMLALDLEEGAGDLGHWALQWCRHVEQRAGFAPMIYSNPSFIREHGLDRVPELARYLLWLSAWQDRIPPAPSPWDAISIWQFSDACTVPGVQGPVDGNWFQGTLDELGRIGKPGVGPSPTDPYAPWRGLIGSGLLQAMETDGTLPAQARSTWLPLGQSPADIEECYGQNGIRYAWTVSTTNQGYRYLPF